MWCFCPLGTGQKVKSGLGHGFFYTPHFQMLRSAHPPVLFGQSFIAHTYFCSGDIKQMICCSLFSSPSSISSASVALPSTQLGEVSERIRAGLLSVFLKKFRKTLVHDHVRRENFTTTPRLYAKLFVFAFIVRAYSFQLTASGNH